MKKPSKLAMKICYLRICFKFWLTDVKDYFQGKDYHQERDGF